MNFSCYFMVKMETLVDLLDWVPVAGLVKINYCDFSERLLDSQALMATNCFYQAISTATAGIYILERLSQ